MTDMQLVNIAIEDGDRLPPATFEILKTEFIKRDLDRQPLENAEQSRLETAEENLEKIRNSSPAGHEKATWNYLFEEKEKKTPDVEIITGLGAMGVGIDEAREMIANTTLQLKKLIDRHYMKASIGGIIFVLALLFTAYTFLGASLHGGSYYVAWGALVLGPWYFFSETSKKNHYKKILAAISK